MQRIDGFIAELQRGGIDTSDLWIAESDFSPEGGWAAAELLLQSGRKVSAVFCANDEMAMGAMAHFQQHGLAIPGDLSVIGYDDTPGAAFLVPPLTTVHIPWSAVTYNGLYALLERCYGRTQPAAEALELGVTRRGFRASKVAILRRPPPSGSWTRRAVTTSPASSSSSARWSGGSRWVS